jgi:lysozyme-like protein
MAKLSGSEVAAVAKSAGLSADVDIAVAIALAESGGRSDAHNPVPPDNSYGLWQINMLGSMGPQRRKQLGISSNDDLYDPVTNARAMMLISNGGTNWKPWTTYTRGTYKLYLGKSGTSSGDAGVQNVSVTSSVGELASKIQDGHFWTRIGMYLIGFILIIIAMVMLATGNKIGKAAKLVKAVAK